MNTLLADKPAGPRAGSRFVRLFNWSTTATLICMLATLWGLTHRYAGLSRDGELYALQALAQLQTNLQSDIYLQNISQDRYTVFSSLYAALIRCLSLQSAAILLYAACTLGFLSASWWLARRLAGRQVAWLATALLIVTRGHYGAYQIFSYSESYLSARSLAEALVVTSLALHAHDRRKTAWCVGIGSMFIHPLMTLPGLLLLASMSVSLRTGFLCALAGVVGLFLLAICATHLPSVPMLGIMDPAWLEVVRERSQFLFLRYWTGTDWELTALPFVLLTLALMVIGDGAIRRLCIGAMLVGMSGLWVAWIAGEIGPVALLVQGQAWRWMWVTVFVGVLMIVPTALRIARTSGTGLLCAMLLILAYTYSGVDALPCGAAAWVLWVVKDRIEPRYGSYSRWAALGVGTLMLITTIAGCWSFAAAPNPETGRELAFIGRLREAFAIGVTPVFVVLAAWYAASRTRAGNLSLAAAIIFLFIAIGVLNGSLKPLGFPGSPTEIAAFDDWRARIAPNSNVLMLPTRKSASFAWFTLGRPSYSSVDQSSGVVFSRATALEIRRRSEVLLPVAEPSWRILSQINAQRSGKGKTDEKKDPLTAASLVAICQDPQLGFVVAEQNVGFSPVTHTRSGALHNWNLYDCRPLRTSGPGA